MKGLPAELIYILIFAAVVLFQLITRRFAQQQRPQQESEPDEGLGEYLDDQVPEPPAASPLSTPSVGHFGRTEAPRAFPAPAPAPARRRFSRRSLMRTRQDVQNAIVIAAIVGPCRAFEPHDIR